MLAAKLRDMGVTCRACLEGPWYHKPHDAGETCYKHKLSMGTLSSPLSIAALRKKGDVTPARASDCGNVEGESKASRDASRPLSEYVRFETKEGMALLYDPSPLDKWIGKSYRWDSRRQRHVETSTGDVLSAEDSEDFQRYVQRHNERRQMGNQADELVKLVATHNPAVEEELRIYIGRFPGGVRRLLAEGKKVYKQPVDKQRHGGAASTQTAELRHRKDKTKKDAKKKKGEKKEKKAKKDKKAKKNRRNTPNAGEMVEEKPQQVEAAAEPLIHEEVDWGSEGDDTEPQPAPHAEAAGGESDSDGMSPPVAPLHANWPWGERGRPSDRASSSGGAQRPRTPSRSPRRRGGRKVTLQPGPMWEAVQQVQRHMRRASMQ